MGVCSLMMPSGAMGQEARLEVLQSEFSRVCGLQLLQVLWTADQGLRKPFPPSYFSSLSPTSTKVYAKSELWLECAEIGWSEMELSTK